MQLFIISRVFLEQGAMIMLSARNMHAELVYNDVFE